LRPLRQLLPEVVAGADRVPPRMLVVVVGALDQVEAAPLVLMHLTVEEAVLVG
jgi:hypothetical protein